MVTKTKIFLALLLSVFIPISNAYSQKLKDENDDLLTPKELSVKEYSTRPTTTNFIPDTPNQVDIFQVGSNNVVNVNQGNPGLETNFIYITQQGNNNSTGVDQNGSGNTSTVNQNGNNNQYKVFVSGNNNNSNVTQNGNNNVLDHQLVGDNLNYELIQDGNNNRMMHTDYGSQSGPPQIIQEGNNMNLRIEQR